jgi:hypothetical protein
MYCNIGVDFETAFFRGHRVFLNVSDSGFYGMETDERTSF